MSRPIVMTDTADGDWHPDVSFAPPQDAPTNWKADFRLLETVVMEDEIEPMEPNAAKPDKSYVDSDFEDAEPESVVEKDERTLISPTGSPPYNWLCSLRMTYAGGKRYIGTGFFCTLTGSDRFAIMTCAHNLWSSKRGGYATTVEIIPARDGRKAPFGVFKASTENLRVPVAYQRSPNPKDDYGVIIFKEPAPGGRPFGFGFRVLEDDDLKQRIVQTCGYPGDKAGGTLWLAGGMINRVSERRIFYSNDTYGGQSGGPVWTWSGWNFMLIGIHGYGLKVRNSARRLTNEMAEQIETWIRRF